MCETSVSVTPVTGIDLMRSACKMTFLGESHQSLLSIYKSEHSPSRTQMFWVQMYNIPLFVSTHLLRHHVGSTPYQLTCRDDRNGGNNGFIDKVDRINEKLKLGLIGLDNGDDDGLEDIISDSIDQLEQMKGNCDRYTSVNLGLFINAQSLIDMSKLRLCLQAHKETRKIFGLIKEAVSKVDGDLSNLMVRKCVYRGGICGEPKCCGFNRTKEFLKESDLYLSNFSENQRGIYTCPQ